MTFIYLLIYRFDHLQKIGDFQTLSILSCVFYEPFPPKVEYSWSFGYRPLVCTYLLLQFVVIGSVCLFVYEKARINKVLLLSFYLYLFFFRFHLIQQME